jgi:hypothetical protein
MQVGVPAATGNRAIGVGGHEVGRPVPAACFPTRAVIRFPGCRDSRIIHFNFNIGNAGLLSSILGFISSRYRFCIDVF